MSSEAACSEIQAHSRALQLSPGTQPGKRHGSSSPILEPCEGHKNSSSSGQESPQLDPTTEDDGTPPDYAHGPRAKAANGPSVGYQLHASMVHGRLQVVLAQQLRAEHEAWAERKTGLDFEFGWHERCQPVGIGVEWDFWTARWIRLKKEIRVAERGLVCVREEAEREGVAWQEGGRVW
ncbi:hypothetical protein LTR53_017273 [Teratosphaeriaceae sp. CCFEE 6253]|nr:hypothetical protein LTR53_017273 [Teratosphaeriaceae sp. CCFEE 6253]